MSTSTYRAACLPRLFEFLLSSFIKKFNRGNELLQTKVAKQQHEAGRNKIKRTRALWNNSSSNGMARNSQEHEQEKGGSGRANAEGAKLKARRAHQTQNSSWASAEGAKLQAHMTRQPNQNPLSQAKGAHVCLATISGQHITLKKPDARLSNCSVDTSYSANNLSQVALCCWTWFTTGFDRTLQLLSY